MIQCQTSWFYAWSWNMLLLVSSISFLSLSSRLLRPKATNLGTLFSLLWQFSSCHHWITVTHCYVCFWQTSTTCTIYLWVVCMFLSLSISLCLSHSQVFFFLVVVSFRVNKWQMFCAVWHNFYYIYSGISTSKFTQQQLATHFSFMGSIKKRIPLMENHHHKKKTG